MTSLCVSRPSNQHPVCLIHHPIAFRHLVFKGPSAVFLLACQLSSSTTPKPPPLFITDSHNPSSPIARRSARLATWLISSGKRIKNSYTSPAKRHRAFHVIAYSPAL
ncbi:hypothetical protein CRENBAI_001624 [Crenichthys baileyi]|uniref:Uncharacterized protein n=1 Tax=Crenichthys baileyi TaxID=28760 RepID=A0AAV9QV93_9TELE